jgi:hypothetical protein
VFIDGINGGGIVGLMGGTAKFGLLIVIEGLLVTKGDFVISVTKGDFISRVFGA